MTTNIRQLFSAARLGAIALAAALVTPPASASVDDPEARFPREGWRAAIKLNDNERLAGLNEAWEVGLARARRAGFSRQIDALGPLMKPDAALRGVKLPDGNYRCRLIKVGAATQGLLNYNASPFYACRVSSGTDRVLPDLHERRRGFTKVTGSQRHGGRLFPDTETRLVFLGTLALGTEKQRLPYATVDERDAVGVVERVGNTRWRLALPWPRHESVLDVIELLPAS